CALGVEISYTLTPLHSVVDIASKSADYNGIKCVGC
ncbi:unnamed protein product, partial [marine sediment metagenome]